VLARARGRRSREERRAFSHGAPRQEDCLRLPVSIALDAPFPDPSQIFAPASQPDVSRAPPLREALTEDDDDDDRLLYPTTGRGLPAIEQEALTTRRAGPRDLAVAAGLDAEQLEACAESVGPDIEMVTTCDGDAAGDLVAVLRPRLVIVGARLADARVARIVAAAASYGAQLVSVAVGTTAGVIAPRLRSAAASAFGSRTPANEGRGSCDREQ
jgi:hypothetical protein